MTGMMERKKNKMGTTIEKKERWKKKRRKGE